tara:strand:- start:1778 stop:1996 length:219 start_codon:yes stop_codon:yes gene_type:complete
MTLKQQQIIDEEIEAVKNFIEESVIEHDGFYSTQCSVYRNRLTYEQLLKYIIKEYLHDCDFEELDTVCRNLI